MPCRTVPSAFADAAQYSGWSSPNRDTTRGWSWLCQYRLFQPVSASATCHRLSDFFRATRSTEVVELVRRALVDGHVLELEDHVQLVARRIGVKARLIRCHRGHLAHRHKITVAAGEDDAGHFGQVVVYVWSVGEHVDGVDEFLPRNRRRIGEPVGLGDEIDDVHPEAVDTAVVPMFLLIGTNLAGAVIGFAVLGLLYVPQLATISATFPAMFPTHMRYAGFAIAYNVSTSIFGGTAPAVNDWLTGKTGDDLFPAYYMMAACVIGAIALIKVPKTTRCPLNGTAIPGTADAPPPVAYEESPD